MFKKTGETKVFKLGKEKKGFTKKVAKNQKPERYTVDDLVADSDKGINPYKSKKEVEEVEEDTKE